MKEELQALTCGLYVLGAAFEGTEGGCVINAVMPLGCEEPSRIAVAARASHQTSALIAGSGCFTLSVLSRQTPLEIIKRFGLTVSTPHKFSDIKGVCQDANGQPYLTAEITARFSARVEQTLSVGTQQIWIAEVTEAQRLSELPVMTDADYRALVKQVAGMPEEAGWHCLVCGYHAHQEVLSPEFVCPVCGHARESFQRVESGAPTRRNPLG